MSNQLKQYFLCKYIEATTGKQVDPSDPSITYSVDYIDAAYRLNASYKDVKPSEIFESLQKETTP